MVQRIAVGGEDFIALRKAGSYYVDKTDLLYELVEKNNAVTLFTRPRRFGKTLTMKMMESFFDISRKEGGDAFEGLRIMEHPSFCAEYMNQYPTLFLSLKDVEGRSFDLAFGKLKAVVADVCKRYESLGKESAVNPADAAVFHRLMYETADEVDIQTSLKTLMRMMHTVYGKTVVLLIDEYDVPLAKANAHGFYRQMLDVIRGIMSMSLKTNEHLKFAVVTGCLRIPKESIFTGVNNFASYSVLDEDFAQYFGFTQGEVERMLETFDLTEKMELIREWYDGYVFGDTEAYCPWDVVNYVSALLKRKDAKPKNYWENTSGNDAIRAFFEMRDIDVSEKFEALLNGGTISELITNSLTYEQAYASESNLWSVLLMTGYVTTVHMEDDNVGEESPQQVELRIPNREIAGIFRTAVVDRFKQTVPVSRIQELMNALWDGNAEAASGILSDLLWQTISYMDYHEDYYHAFLAGLFVGRGGYSVQSNRERGLGRPDIDLRDKQNRRAIIIEAKKAESGKRMEHWCDEALKHIAENQYAENLNGYTQVLCYGISFFQKTALVKKM